MDRGPPAGVVMGANGVLYGTTTYGGASGAGTVFALAPPGPAGGRWIETVIYSFDGLTAGYPYTGVVIGTGGALYGIAGPVFALTPPVSGVGSWTYSAIYTFQSGSDGFNPDGLAVGTHCVLYGTTQYGGTACSAQQGCGTVFSLTPPVSPGGSWTKTTLYNFAGGADGSQPTAGVIVGPDGVLYGGTAVGGGSRNLGTIFSLTPPRSPSPEGQWTERTLYRFRGGKDGRLALDSNGVLYGIANDGDLFCPKQCGIAFSLARSGDSSTKTVLHYFTGGGAGVEQADVTVGPRGVLYGASYCRPDCALLFGRVFTLSPPAVPGGSWTTDVIGWFAAANGDNPNGELILGPDGVVYGTTGDGGTENAGTVFALRP